MDVTFVNRRGTAEDIILDRNLLLFSVLFAEKVNFASYITPYLRFEAIKKLEFRRKIDYLKAMMPYYSPMLKDEEVDKYLNDYFRLKAKRNKRMEEILLMKVCEKALRQLEESYIRYMSDARKYYSLDAVHALDVLEKYDLLNFDMPEAKVPDGMELVPYYITAMLDPSYRQVPVMDMAIRNLPEYKDEFSFTCYDGSLIISPKAFLSVPFPGGLSMEQLRMLRLYNLELYGRVFKFFVDIVGVKEKIDYADADYTNRLKIFFAKLDDLSGTLQTVLNRNLQVNFLRNSRSNVPEMRLHFGFCSNKTLLYIYRDLKIIDDSTCLFIQDYLRNKIKMNSWLPLLIVDSTECLI